MVQLCIIGLHIFAAFLESVTDIDPTVSLYAVAVVFTVHSVWAVTSWGKISRRWFDPYVLFIISAVLFNGGQILLLLFGLPVGELAGGKFDLDTLVRSAFLISFGLVMVHFGGLLGLVLKHRKNEGAVSQRLDRRDVQLDGLRIVGLTLLVLSVVPSGYLLVKSVALAIGGGYMALYQQDFATGVGAAPRILANFLVPSSFLLLASYRGRRQMVRLSLLLICLHSLTYLFIGYRGLSLFPIIAYAWLWHRIVRPISKPALAVFAVLLLFLVPAVSTVRGLAGGERVSLVGLIVQASALDNPISMTLREMGNTMRTVAYTIDLVPSVRPFDQGASYLYAVTTAMPNLFWKIHPAVAHGTPSEWLVWAVNPWLASRGGGLGYSFIAEAYFNFGWWGAPLVMLVIGYAFSRFVRWSLRSETPARLAAVACFMPAFLFYARADTSLIMRPLMWYVMIPYLLVSFVGRSLRHVSPKFQHLPPQGQLTKQRRDQSVPLT